jgi:exosome complex protein LRP1
LSHFRIEKFAIDKAAAGRFIKHAITQSQRPVPQPDSAIPSSSTLVERVPVKITSKMAERAQYEKELNERDSEDDEEAGLEVFGGEVNDVSKGKGPETVVGATNKRRRPAVDPFAGACIFRICGQF